MTYTFKLARRLAQVRTVSVVTGALLTASCAGGDGLNDPASPGSDPASPGLTILPDSITVGTSDTVQFTVNLVDGSTASFSKSGRGKGHNKLQPTAMTVSPNTTTLTSSSVQFFVATETMTDGTISQPSVRWTATGGTIDSTGKYVAASTPGQYSVVAIASDGMADTATATVVENAPTVARVVLSPTSATVTTGGSQQFTAVGKASDGSTTVAITPTYTATGGSITGSGTYTAGQAAGTFRVIALDPATNLADTAAVTVVVNAPTVVGVVLSPTSAAVTTGGTQQFTAVGQVSDGSTASITPTYSATGGTITPAGLYTAGQTAGSHRVIATDPASGLADTSTVTITSPTPTLQAVVLTPASVSLAPGATQQFAASGKMSDGSTSSVSVTWTASGGTISSSGFYTAGTTGGAFRVVGTQQGGTKADTSSVTITTPAPSSGSCARTVNVSTASGLSSAINNALPGDCIVMAPGTYSGGFTITRSGTAQNPIRLTGPRTAIVGTGSGGDGMVLSGASYWVLKGFRISQPTNGGVSQYGGTGVTYDSLEVDHTGGPGIQIRVLSDKTVPACCVRGTEIRYSYIHDTGVTTPWGEGIYVASSYGNQGVRGTYIHHNTIGPTSAEPIELKVLADSSRIEFNLIRSTNGLVIRSDYNTFNDNTLAGPLGPSSTGALVGFGSDVTGDTPVGNVARRNTGSGAPKLFFIYPISNTTATIYCDNNVIGSTLLGVTCTP